MIDAQAVRLPQQGADEVAVGGVAGGVEPVGTPRGQAPVLALLAERVRRRADPRAEGEHVLPRPAVEALGVAADGQVMHQAHAHRTRRGADVAQLPLDLALQPGVVGDARGELGGRARDGGRRRVPQVRGPPAPLPAVTLRQRAEDGEEVEVWRGRGGCGTVRGTPQQLGRRALGGPAAVVVDAAADRLGPQRVDLGPGGGVGVGVGVDVGDAQRERRAEAPARRRVGRRLDGWHRRDRVQRVEQYGRRAVLGAGPAGEGAQVAEVTEAPGRGGVQGVELQHPAPRPRDRRQGAGRRHDGDDVVVSLEPVPARGEARRDLGDVLPHARLVDQDTARRERAGFVRAGGDGRGGPFPHACQRDAPRLRGARVDLEQPQHADHRVGGDGDRPPVAVPIGGRHAVGGGDLRKVVVHARPFPL